MERVDAVFCIVVNRWSPKKRTQFSDMEHTENLKKNFEIDAPSIGLGLYLVALLSKKYRLTTVSLQFPRAPSTSSDLTPFN